MVSQYVYEYSTRTNGCSWMGLSIFYFSFVVSIIQVPYNAIIIAREQMNIYAYMSIIEVCLKLLVVFMLMWIGYDKLKLYAILIFSVTVVIALFYRIYCKCKFSECKYHLCLIKYVLFTNKLRRLEFICKYCFDSSYARS